MFVLVLLALPIMGTAIKEILEFQEGMDIITISKTGELSRGCRFRMSRKEEVEEDVFCCYGEMCDPEEQSVECREEGDYSVEKNITRETVGECVLRLKGTARKDDSGNYIAEFLGGGREGSKQFQIKVTEGNGKNSGLHPVMILPFAIIGLAVLLIGILKKRVDLHIVVLWKKTKKHLGMSRDRDFETIQPDRRKEMKELTNHIENI